MKTFVIRRAVFMVMSVIAATLIVFSMSRLQGDPRYLFLASGYASQEAWDAWGEEFGLDKPLPVQYFIWLGKGMKGDFGKSLKSGYTSVDMIKIFAPASIQLGLAAWVFVLLTGIPLGVLSAVKRGSIWDLIGRTFAVFGQALPPFWLGIMLILIFAVKLDWLPPGQRGGPTHYILPAMTLGWLASAGMMRLVRSAMLEVLDSEYIKLARAKGVSTTSVIWKHAFRNALIPPLTFGALIMASFIAGTVVTETVFAWPGLGFMTVNAIVNNDFPVMTTAVMVFTILYLVVVFIVDILYAYIDPRIRLG
ncbi:MAG: ABC transporter permease [SAR202 cluster bacterium Casp-Chloro-G4]|nr:MAG: ABC transporter permease [SAR202 cluster bacterium Casp-Chloro-G4]